MSDVQFDDSQEVVQGIYNSRVVATSSSVPLMVKWLLKLGVKNEKVAKYILLVISIAFFIITFVILSQTFGGSTVNDYPPVRGPEPLSV